MKNNNNVFERHGVFVVAVMVLLVVPLLGMPFFHEDASSEKRDLAPAPTLTTEDGALNLNVLSDAGAYFSDHFAFRSMLVDADATIKQRLFGTSSTSNVVVGTNGWLYYAGSLNDYQRKNSMSDRALQNAAYNLRLMQRYFEAQGKRFVVAIAPNKNELYAQNMPYYQLAGEGQSNFERLCKKMDEYQVNYVNLHEAFRSNDDVLYFMRDSHWNDQGAIFAYRHILSGLGRQALAFDDELATSDEHIGDVDAMLHPSFAQPEEQVRHQSMDNYSITNDATSVEDSYLVTKSNVGEATGTLIMYRDSFGNNLLKPFATTYAQSVFTKLVPYDMGTQMTAFAQDVVVERTERHLSFFATDPPYLPAPACSDQMLSQYDLSPSNASVSVSQYGSYFLVEGSLDAESNEEQADVFVEVTFGDGAKATYQAFRVSASTEQSSDFEGASTSENAHIVGDNGYRAYIPNADGRLNESSAVRILA